MASNVPVLKTALEAAIRSDICGGEALGTGSRPLGTPCRPLVRWPLQMVFFHPIPKCTRVESESFRSVPRALDLPIAVLQDASHMFPLDVFES